MIKRLYLRNLVTFDEVELPFSNGLVVFSGPSGAGKSVLMSAILSNFGYTTQGVGDVCELTIDKPINLQPQGYLLDDEITLKALKKEKLRYFIGGQNISKKSLKEIFSPYVQYLCVRDKKGFESETLIDMLDRELIIKNKSFKRAYKEYSKRYEKYKQKADQLAKIKADEAKRIELSEFAKYEIEKIDTISPKVGEEEELLEIKQTLSRIDKIEDALTTAMEIFEKEASVEEVYRLLNKDGSIFSEAMNQLRTDLEDAQNIKDELADIDVEEVLNRLGDLTSLKNRYGSIEEALEYRDRKSQEIRGYETITQDKSILESFLAMEFTELHILASQLCTARKEHAKEVEKNLKNDLKLLKLPLLSFHFDKKSLYAQGNDTVSIALGESSTDTLSGGEFNRLRLALMAMMVPQSSQNQGVLILDEIDANVSGDESIAIAQMIQKLSQAYQVFAISHQPHLSSKAKQHILVTKKNNKSQVTILDEQERIREIARIIAGENPTLEAVEFAKKLRG